LLCPRCGADNLHHSGVIVFDRPEDAASVTEIRVEGNKVQMNQTTGDKNPSSRRDGLSVNFNCEQCGDGIQLTIAQHKGSTEIGWRFKECDL